MLAGKFFRSKENFRVSQEILKLKLVREEKFHYKSHDGPDAHALSKIFGDSIRTQNRSEVKICGRKKEKEKIRQKKEVVVS